MSHPTSTSTSADRRRTGAIGLAAAGFLLGAGGVMHPRVDTSLTFDEGLAGMFESSLWNSSHLLTMAGYLALAVSLTVLVNAAGQGWSGRMRTVGRVAAVGASLAAVESVPHLLAATQSGLADVHTTLQAFSSPLFGLSIVTLAVAGARSGALNGGRIAAALAVAGGLAFALAGPAIALTHDSAFSPLFAGAAGVAIWAVVAGIRTARRVGRDRAAAPVLVGVQGS